MGAQGDPLAYRQDGECLFISNEIPIPSHLNESSIGLWNLKTSDFVVCIDRKMHLSCIKFCVTISSKKVSFQLEFLKPPNF